MTRSVFSHLGRIDSKLPLKSAARDVFIRSVSIGGLAGSLMTLGAKIWKPVEIAEKPKILKQSGLHHPRVVVYAHFDANGQLSSADESALACYREAGYQLIVVTTSASWPVDKLELADAVIIRPNVGFDFGSWQTAIKLLLPIAQRRSLDHLVLVNNSVYGPLWPVSELLTRAREQANVVTTTKSREWCPHFHSYFLSFDHKALISDAFDTYWSQNFAYTNKWPVIVRGELRWERHFRNAGLTTDNLIPLQTRIRRTEFTFFWDGLIQSGLPYLKKSLFKQNYDNINLAGWREQLGKVAPLYDLSLIERDIPQGTP